MEPEGSLPHSQASTISLSYTRPKSYSPCRTSNPTNSISHQNMRKQQIYKAINKHKKAKILEKTNLNTNTISKFPK